MKLHRFLFIFLFLLSYPLFAFEFETPISNFKWTLDMTMGMQNMNLLSQENGANAKDTFLLETSGFIFHSFYKDRLLSRAVLDLGFSKKPDFFWSDKPDFMHNEELNENLKCVEVEYQLYLPKIEAWFIKFLPFGGFSFVNLSDKQFYGEESFTYFSWTAGVQYFSKINRYFTHTYYISYSPMMTIERFSYQHTIHYINYGTELIMTTRHLNLTLFMIFRKVYEDFEKAIVLFDEKNYTINTTEIGFSFEVFF